ncbi:MAG: hypothetical protein HZT43_01345 [Exiguobacterium profundum]|nr:MAG: hypothetical protein HZT43_01345 [Exiguobacterium profundum]
MTVIRTARNLVCAYEPQEQDCFVHTLILGSETRHLLTTQTIEHYREAVDWAVGIADQMEHPLEVVPVDAVEYLKRHRDALASLSDQERGDLRQLTVASMLQIMRDSADETIRADAYDVLQKLKVIE